MTSYVVLRKDDSGMWIESGPRVESVSAEAAVRKSVLDENGGTYIAVPLRSWNPIVVKVETTRVVKLEVEQEFPA